MLENVAVANRETFLVLRFLHETHFIARFVARICTETLFARVRVFAYVHLYACVCANTKGAKTKKHMHASGCEHAHSRRECAGFKHADV